MLGLRQAQRQLTSNREEEKELEDVNNEKLTKETIRKSANEIIDCVNKNMIKYNLEKIELEYYISLK